MKSVTAFNKALIAKNIPVELFKGDGYFYFMGKNSLADNIENKLESIYVHRFNHLSTEQWNNIFDDVVKLYKELTDERTEIKSRA